MKMYQVVSKIKVADYYLFRSVATVEQTFFTSLNPKTGDAAEQRQCSHTIT